MQPNEQITQKVIEAIAKVRDVPTDGITIDSTFEELNVDSLDAIEVVFEVEEAFDIKVPTDQLENLRTVRDVVGGIEKLLEAKKQGKPLDLPFQLPESAKRIAPGEPGTGEAGAQA